LSRRLKTVGCFILVKNIFQRMKVFHLIVTCSDKLDVTLLSFVHIARIIK